MEELALAWTSFLDFDLRLEPSGDKYRARVIRSPAGEVAEDTDCSPGVFDLEGFLQCIGRPARGMLRDARHRIPQHTQAAELLPGYGTRLFEAAFPGQVAAALQQSLEEARRENAGLRIRLRLGDAPELADLPWEYLHDPQAQSYVTLSAEVCLSRYPELLRPIQPLAVTPPLQVLVVIANPSDLPALDVEREWQSLNEALAGLEEEGRIEISRLEDATLPALQRELRRGDFHILHFIGHGDFDAEAQNGILILEDDAGCSDPVLTGELTPLVHDELRTLRLVMLNTCKGARASREDPFAGLARGLLKQGVPAVVAMQFDISDQAAITFSREFYRSVADGFPIDYSVGEGRKAVYVDDNPIEWGIPVLFMRSPDGRIFDVVEQAERPSGRAAAWFEAAWRLAARYRVVLSLFLVLEAALAGAYLGLAARYLIPWWCWLLAALLVPAAVAGWRRWDRARPVTLHSGLALLATAGLLALLGWQTARILKPRPFAGDLFGIAVAELGEGPRHTRTARARELSSEVYDQLCTKIKNQYAVNSCEEPARARDASAGASGVVLRSVGVMPDAQSAEEYAADLQADIIVWGDIRSTEEGGVTIHFRPGKTQDIALSSEIPLVLPVRASSADLYQRDLDLDSAQVKGVIAQQAAILADFALGLEALYDLRYPQAAARFDSVVQAIEQNPSLTASPAGRSLFFFYLARAYHGLGQIEEGQAWLQRAGEEDPAEPAVPMALALGYGSLGQEAERDAQLHQALDLVGDWLRTHPEDNIARYDRGIIYEMMREYEDAVIDFQEVTERDPDCYVAYISLALNASKLGRYEEAIETLNAAIDVAKASKLEPGWAHLNLALIYDKLGQPEDADREFQNAIASVHHGWICYCYGQFLEGQGEIEAAREAYGAMVEVSRDRAWAYDRMADFLRRRGDLAGARDAYENAAHERPKDPLLRTYLAEVYFELGRDETDPKTREECFEKSRKEFDEALTLGPGLYYSFSTYGNVLFQMGDLDGAVVKYERSLELRPRDWGVLLNLGLAYELLGRTSDAKAAYRQILAAPKDYPQQAIQKANDRLQRLGEPEGASEPQ
jgi:tetratricopeptide (TPR) repeat protein